MTALTGRRPLAAAATALAAALTLAACGGGPAAATGPDGRITLTLATVATDTCAQAFIGRDRGIFAEHGMDVTVNVVGGVPELAAAVTSGQAQLACSAPTAVASAVNQGLPFTMVAPGIEYTKDNPGSFLMTTGDSPVTGIAQLGGTTVAVNALNTLPHLATMAMLQDSGVDPAGVTFVNIAFPNIGQALETGQVQSGILQPPYQQDLEANGGQRIASPYDFVNGGEPFVYTVWFGTEDFAAANPEAVRAVRDAMTEISVWANDPANADARRAILATATGQDPAVIARSTLCTYGTALTPDLLQSQFDLQRRFGTLPGPVNAADLIAAS